MNQTQGNSKEVRTPRYLSLVVPLRKVGDEAVHKELGDRMERAATTASSSEAEQDSGSGPRCQDTILGDVDAQTSYLWDEIEVNAGSSNLLLLVLESDRFAEIVDFLKASSVSYALTVNPIIYTSCIQQFWATAQVKMVIIMEASIRNDLHLDDAEGTDCLPNSIIFKELAKMGLETSHHKKTFVNPFHTKKIFANMKREGKDFSRKVTPLFDSMLVQATEEVGEDSIPLTDSTQTPIIDQPSTSSQPKKKQKSRRKQKKEAETAHAETEEEEHFNTSSNDPLPSSEDSMQLNELMVLCTQLQQQVLNLEKAKSDQAIEIASLKKRVDKLKKRRQLRTTGLTRFKKLGTARRVKSSNVGLGAQEDASKQGMSIEDIDADVKVTLVNEQQNEDLMFDTRVLNDDEVFMGVASSEKNEQSTKLDDSTAGEAVTTASVEDSDAPTIQVSTADIGEVTAAKINELTLAQTLIEIKAAKPKVVTTAATTTTTRPKDKGKGIMVEPEVPLKRKDQIALDEQIARDIQAKLDAELEEEQKLIRKQEEEANIALIES
ncbi:hypothetical protein Tco_0065785 [Tanacetum coccineum]